MKEKTTILIADDNADFAMTLVKYLEKEEDMEVIGIAKNGKEACDMVLNARARRITIRCDNAILRWNRSIRIHKFI